jgi:hypothetical protein
MSNTIVTQPNGHPTAASHPDPAALTTHEAFIHAVRASVLPRVADTTQRARLAEAKLVYGAGHAMGARGVTFYGAWANGMPGHDFLEVCAAGEETTVQLAGTTIHELAHCLAGNTAGHASEWKAACKTLGLIHAEAAGQSYAPKHFAADLWAAIAALPAPDDGRPTFANRGRGPGIIAGPATPRPCPLGIGTRGGRSRGAGSGSRLRLWLCACGVKVRVASNVFDATCNRCGTGFKQADRDGARGRGVTR